MNCMHGSNRRSRFVSVLLLAVILQTSAARAQRPRPPQPNPYHPVNYIEWYNRVMTEGIQDNAADVYEHAFRGLELGDVQWEPTLTEPWFEHPSAGPGLEKHARAIELFRRATGMSKCAFRIRDHISDKDSHWDHAMIWACIPDVRGHRELSKALIADGFHRWARGDHTALPANAACVLGAAGHLAEGPALMHRLAAVANAGLASNALLHCLRHADQKGEFAVRALSVLPPIDRLEAARGGLYFVERIMVRDYCQRSFVADEHGGLVPHSDWRRLLSAVEVHTLERIGYAATLRECEMYFDELDEWAMQPYHRSLAQAERLARTESDTMNPLNRVWLTCHVKVRVWLEEGIAECRGTYLTLHLFAYQQRMGTFPVSLDELDAPGMTEQRIDPFSGRDMVYRRIPSQEAPDGEESFILYSVAGNCKDDGGRHGEQWEADDHVFWPVFVPAPQSSRLQPLTLLGRLIEHLRTQSQPAN